MIHLPIRLLVASAITISGIIAAEPVVLDRLDEMTLRAGNEHVRIEAVEGHQGRALHLAFDEKCASAFAISQVRGRPEWDQAAGISFWVKGDGSTHCGGLQVVWNDDYEVRYDVAFPITSTAWTRVVIPWSDLIPVLGNAKGVALDPAGAHKPSQLGQLWFGKWWYWGDYAAHGYAIDDLRLEPVIAPDTADRHPAGAPLARVAAKLKAGQPITMVTMGDSLTDLHHWTNRTTNWPAFFAAAAQERWHVVPTMVNPALGGTELKQNVVLIPRWLATTPKPDLVTICFGFNDWSSGMRGERFRVAMVDAIRRVRRLSDGAADVLVIVTVPGLPLWDELGELAQAGRQAAAEEHAGLCDAYAAFQAAAKDGGRERLYVDDHVHLSPAGQQVLAQAVLAAIAAEGR